MNLKNKNKSIAIFLILVIIIFTCFFSIKILTEIKTNMEIENVLTQNITNANWPESVPIIQSKFVNVTKVSEKSWEINIKEYISYEDFKAYLIELYTQGFEPIKEMGSDNPKRLNSNIPNEEDIVLIWCGKNTEYSIEASWYNKNYDTHNEDFERDCVTILLYANSLTNLDIETEINKNENILSGDSVSGEIFESGEFSGDNILISGD